MDEADRAQQEADALDEVMRKKRQSKPYEIPPGEPGECDVCGEYFARLVNMICARCRDKYKL